MIAKAQHTEFSAKTIHRYHPAKPTKQDPGLLSKEPDALALRRAIAHPTVAGSASILALQRTAGNRAVTGLIQAKLTVGAPGDVYEQEADRVAEQVMQMGKVADGQTNKSANPQMGTHHGTGVQRQSEEEELQTKPLVQRQAEEEEELQAKPLVQRQAEEEEEIQAKPLVQRQADGSFEAGSGLESRLAAQKGRGNSLPDDVRAFMEPRFGVDFSRVRIHDGSEAIQMNKELNAQAFTHGQNIYFNAGRYNPNSQAGRLLLAHELTHTLQQNGGSRISRWADFGHKLVTLEALNRIPNVKQKFSNRVMGDIANGSGDLDHRIKPISGIVFGTLGGKLKKFGVWSAGLMMNKRVKARWTRALFEANAFHMRPKSELPNHGEAGAYRRRGQEGVNIARVNDWVDKAVAAAEKQNLGATTKYLAYALHAAEDRGSHGEGNPGTGHDPRCGIPPQDAPGGTNEWYIDKNWNPDDLAINAAGKELAIQYAVGVLNDFRDKCTHTGKHLVAFEFGSTFVLEEKLQKGRSLFSGGKTKGGLLGAGF
jgi:hypothetical protein